MVKRCLIRKNDIIISVYIYIKHFNINVLILDGIGTIYYVAIYKFTIKNVVSYWKLVFCHEIEARDRPLPIQDTLANASGSPAVNPWNGRAGPHLTVVDWQFLNIRFPAFLDL